MVCHANLPLCVPLRTRNSPLAQKLLEVSGSEPDQRAASTLSNADVRDDTAVHEIVDGARAEVEERCNLFGDK